MEHSTQVLSSQTITYKWNRHKRTDLRDNQGTVQRHVQWYIFRVKI